MPVPFLNTCRNWTKWGSITTLPLRLMTTKPKAWNHTSPGWPHGLKNLSRARRINRGKTRGLALRPLLILSPQLTVEKLLAKIENVGQQLHEYTEKLIISFVDIAQYRRVQNNLITGGFTDYREFDQASIRAVAAGLQEINQKWGVPDCHLC